MILNVNHFDSGTKYQKMLAKILKRHTSRDHLHHGGNSNNKLSPSKNPGSGAGIVSYPANPITNGHNANGTLTVSLDTNELNVEIFFVH